jgi:hypothetical protein
MKSRRLASSSETISQISWGSAMAELDAIGFRQQPVGSLLKPNKAGSI